MGPVGTEYVNKNLDDRFTPHCPLCGASQREPREPRHQRRMLIAELTARYRDGSTLVGHVAVCRRCGLAVPLQARPPDTAPTDV